MTMQTPSMKTLLKAIAPITPYNWTAERLTVVGDGYLEDGTRVHVVKESLPEQPIKIRNAWVINAQM